MKKLVAVLLCFWSALAFAESGTFIAGGYAIPVASNSCNDVKTAFMDYFGPVFTNASCNSDPVQSGTLLDFYYDGASAFFVVDSITATSSNPSPSPSASMPTVIELAPFNLSTTEGGLIAVAILGVWASAFAFKAAVRALSGGSPEN